MADYKLPVNYHAPSTIAGEVINVDATGFAILAEAPADPATYPMTVTIGGSSRTRVTGVPGVGQYRVLTQTIYGADGQAHLEYLPVLQFSSADNNTVGAATYSGTGTIITSQFFGMLVAFLTPLIGYSDSGSLPTATTDPTKRGRPGDLAMLADASMWCSDGTMWNQVASGSYGQPRGALTLAHVLAVAQDFQYASDMLSDEQLVSTYGLSAIASYYQAGLADSSYEVTHTLSMDGVAAVSSAMTVAQTMAMTLDAVLSGGALTGSTTYDITHTVASDRTWAAGGSSPSIRSSTMSSVASAAANINVTVPSAQVGDKVIMLCARQPVGEGGNPQLGASLAGAGTGGAALTLTLLDSANLSDTDGEFVWSNGSYDIWVGTVLTAVTNAVLTTTAQAASGIGIGFAVVVQDPGVVRIAGGTARSFNDGSGALSSDLTGLTTGSLIIGISYDHGQQVIPTILAGQSQVARGTFGTSSAWLHKLDTTTSSSTLTFGSSSPTSGSGVIVAVEIKAV